MSARARVRAGHARVAGAARRRGRCRPFALFFPSGSVACVLHCQRLQQDKVDFLATGAAIQEAVSDSQRWDRRYFGIDVPFMEHIGLQPVSLDAGCCITRLAWQPHLANSRGDAHGGLLMSAMDFTLSAAARAHDPLGLGAITVDMSTHFYEAARTALTIEGRCIRHGRSMAFCDGEVRDEQGTVVAVARAVFKLVRLSGPAR